MAILRFATNVPQQVHLRSLEPKVVDSQFGGIQHMFNAEEGIFYVSDKVGAILGEQFARLGVKPGTPCEITKAEAGNGAGRKTQWIVSTQSDADETPSELEVKLAESIAHVEARKQAARAQTATTQPEWAQHLVAQSIALVDAYAEVLRHASQHQNVRGEDVRSLFLSAFINVTKSGATGGRNAA